MWAKAIRALETVETVETVERCGNGGNKLGDPFPPFPQIPSAPRRANAADICITTSANSQAVRSLARDGAAARRQASQPPGRLDDRMCRCATRTHLECERAPDHHLGRRPSVRFGGTTHYGKNQGDGLASARPSPCSGDQRLGPDCVTVQKKNDAVESIDGVNGMVSTTYGLRQRDYLLSLVILLRSLTIASTAAGVSSPLRKA